MQINVMSNIKDVKRKMTNVEKVVIPKATSMALNKTLSKTYTFVVREVAKATGFKQKDLRQLISKRRANARYQEAVITVRGKAPNLIRFNARQTKTGVSSTAWGHRKNNEGAFIANQGRTVFHRTSEKSHPIKPNYGPRPWREFLRQEIDKSSSLVAVKNFNTEFIRAVNFKLGKL
jgi:hypothetical protein